MVLVYNIKNDLNVLPVSKQSFSQVWGDLKREKKLLYLKVCFHLFLNYTETTSIGTNCIRSGNHLHILTPRYSTGYNLPLQFMLKDT